MSDLSTCGRCGGTIEWYDSPDPFIRGRQWRHVTATPGGHTHQPSPDDGAVSGPGRDDREPCPACHHVHDTQDEEDECGTEVGTGLFGSDGVEVTRWCLCTGPEEARPAEDSYADPWLDPDAAARAVPPPF